MNIDISLFPPTIVIRHRKENLKKCSLQGLEKRKDFLFFRYPLKEMPPCEDYVLLTMDASEELTASDHSQGLLVLDATWRYALNMEKNLHFPSSLRKRRLPKGICTAYPRKQTDCSEPSCGLASLEAIACAYFIMGRPFENLLDGYYWKAAFLAKNKNFLLQCSHAEQQGQGN